MPKQTSGPTSLKKIVEALVKKAETNQEVKEDLLERTADIVKDSEEFKEELLKAVLANKKLREDALKEVIEEVLD